MRFEFFVALRYLFARREQAFISVISWLSVAGVALGVASLIVVMGVMNGFTTDLRDKIIGVTAHAVLMNGNRELTDNPELLQKINAVPGVTASTPFIHSELMLSTRSGFKGVILRGIDPKTAPQVLGALHKMTEGSLEDIEDAEGLPGIVIGSKLARLLNLFVGSRVNLLAPSGQQSAAGYTPRVMPFRIVGIFSIGLVEYDTSLAFVSLNSARDVMGWPENLVSGIEIALIDIYDADKVSSHVVEALDGGAYYIDTWMNMNANLFAALKLEKTAMTIILALIVLVGSFSIITALVMLVMEKTRDIAILMSMGATRGAIRRIFMVQGVIIGTMGTSIGLALGLGICFLLKRYQFIELPRDIYSLNVLPVLISWPDICLTAICTMIICFFATLYPANQAARLEPVTALRHE